MSPLRCVLCAIINSSDFAYMHSSFPFLLLSHLHCRAHRLFNTKRLDILLSSYLFLVLQSYLASCSFCLFQSFFYSKCRKLRLFLTRLQDHDRWLNVTVSGVPTLDTALHFELCGRRFEFVVSLDNTPTEALYFTTESSAPSDTEAGFESIPVNHIFDWVADDIKVCFFHFP